MQESEREVCSTLLFVAIPKTSLFHECSIRIPDLPRSASMRLYQDINKMLYLPSMPCL